MITPHLRPLVELRVTVDRPIEVGDLPDGYRRVIPITGGDVTGERLRGEVLPGGADWNTIRPDDTMNFWARYTLRSHDGVTIGVIHEASHPNVSAALPMLGAGNDPGDAWHARGIPRFEAPAGPYAWLNDVVCVSAIRPPIEPGVVRIDVFEVT
ncbi:MAG TPA: DUF3237 domain-containing protein [Ilumatobacter sp.]|nr:DUF3237 domain-containing protein [Ilumatobacter sp.]